MPIGHPAHVRPTGRHGARYAEEVRGVLARLGQATLALRTNPDGGTLSLAILPAFGMH